MFPKSYTSQIYHDPQVLNKFHINCKMNILGGYLATPEPQPVYVVLLEA